MDSQPTFDQNKHTYIIDPRLKAAVEVALDLGLPLLVTGEPGTGKTKLANYIAGHMLDTQLLVFNTKTGSKARDLLYKYNAITHFRDSQLRSDQDLNPMNYLAFEALGKAITESGNTRYVVLIDEIDKAPRDFPNDVLFEFEHLAFKVDEATADEVKAWSKAVDLSIQPDDQGYLRVPKASANRPVLIITSNSEKNLPDAFLRRCVYYNIPFPNTQRLLEIVQANIPLKSEFTDKMLKDAVNHFEGIREKGLRKKPATAELLAWIHLLQKNDIDVKKALGPNASTDLKEQILRTYAVLSKNQADFQRLKEELNM